ncbi:unannotated protein [freshwater metagenome]|uniref:Unannotated protein n=1 Tax=freshwater metagenome TaxID=449393 RepID=A0A6J6XFG7_9ZZZZ|nr:hypothetical protein [Actinomycetota bacterium]MSW23970.1 hypothetical protein [Actinomycetota bacterium]MSX29665.1 hypothetical protein [Actinomycetota bacterium]MSX44044.1 hypothetical protein [Actinomycetota bacterium]MSX96765.1 hypothetical protein [Actinomycetota bacterium]
MRKTVLAVGVIETLVVFGYGLSIVIRGTYEHSQVGSPLVQFIIYTIFASSLAATTVGISKGQNWARTPFYLLQCFVAIAGYTLVSGTILIYQIVGLVTTAIGVVGFIALLRSPDKN